MENHPQQALEERICALTEYLSTIRRNMEKLDELIVGQGDPS